MEPKYLSPPENGTYIPRIRSHPFEGQQFGQCIFPRALWSAMLCDWLILLVRRTCIFLSCCFFCHKVVMAASGNGMIGNMEEGLQQDRKSGSLVEVPGTLNNNFLCKYLESSN